MLLWMGGGVVLATLDFRLAGWRVVVVLRGGMGVTATGLLKSTSCIPTRTNEGGRTAF